MKPRSLTLPSHGWLLLLMRSSFFRRRLRGSYQRQFVGSRLGFLMAGPARTFATV